MRWSSEELSCCWSKVSDASNIEQARNAYIKYAESRLKFCCSNIVETIFKVTNIPCIFKKLHIYSFHNTVFVSLDRKFRRSFCHYH